MNIRYFTHSLRSCWNHGNAHFLRGVLRALGRMGHSVRALEPDGAWSVRNLLADKGEAALLAWQEAYPELEAYVYQDGDDLESLADGADLVIVHEWNDPALVAALGAARRRGARFRLLFHDTHHRAVSDSEAMRAYDLSGYDGVLAFGESLAAVYRRWEWGERAFVWHEAADIELFRPPEDEMERAGAVWIGNWGDGERTAELERLLLRPTQAAGIGLDVYGVRYPEEARAMLDRFGARYRGWLPNYQAPRIFARHALTVHVPRRFYAGALPGIPTIRVFEALACGIPLISAPWDDCEGLFTPGVDFLTATNEAEMTERLQALAGDPALRQAVAAHGLATVRARHTCEHRAEELMAIMHKLDGPRAA